MRAIPNNAMKSILAIIPTLALLLSCSCSKTEKPEDDRKNGTDTTTVIAGKGVSLVASKATRVARVIGATPSGETCPNPNNSMKRFGIGSTDFGNMWDAGNGTLWCIFGDNFNDRGGSWRSNAVALSTDRDLSDGLYYDDVLRNPDGTLMEPIVSRAKTGQYSDGSQYEVTCIPTGGVAIPYNGGHRQIINYMSVHQWATGGNDRWSVNYSELVYSDDYGKSFVRSGVKWDAESHFAQVAYVLQEDTLYMWGTASGRYDNVYLAKVEASSVLDKSAYSYWDGESWTADEAEAAPVASGTVSEMTVRYNSRFKCYLMMYLAVGQRKLVYRDAVCPWGEWSAEKPLQDSNDVNIGGYGPSIHPWFCDGDDLWFVLSSVTSNSAVDYDTWHIHLWKAELQAEAEPMNMLWEGGFEYDPGESISYRTRWTAPNANSTRDCHSGKIACKLVNGTAGEWKDACVQTVVVHKNTDYVLRGWAKSSLDAHTGAYLGARLPSGAILDTNPALSSGEWTEITKEFNSGDNTSIDIFFGTWGAEGLSVIVDDIVLTPKHFEQ